jgi:hypothetical protein
MHHFCFLGSFLRCDGKMYEIREQLHRDALENL